MEDSKNKNPSNKRGRPKGSKNKPKESPEPKKSIKNTPTDIYKVLGDYCDKIAADNQLEKINKLNEKLEKAYYQEYNDITANLKYCENVLSENLEDFIVFGHTYDGRLVKVYKATNVKDMNALREASRRVIFPFIMGEQDTDEQF